MGLWVHLGRAALIFWVAAILLPTAVQALSVPQQSSPRAALLEVSTTADSGRDRLRELTTSVRGVEDDVRRVASRVRLEVERFIARLP